MSEELILELPNFELLLLSNLLYNPAYLKKTIPHLDAEYFHNQAERKLFEVMKDYIYKYNVAPTREAIAIVLNDMTVNESLFEGAIQVLGKLRPDESNVEWLYDKTEKWAQEKAIYNSIMQAISIIDGKDKNLDKNAIPGLLTHALSVSFDSYIGHSYFDQAEEQYDYYHSDITKFPFKQDVMNRLTKGGVPKKTLNIVQAGINVGKTTWLVDTASHWLSQGKNVMVFTMEVAEEVYRERIDVCLMDKTFDQVHALEKAQYLGHVGKIRNATRGELYIKEFGSGSAHVGHFRHVLEELKIKKNFVPDVIIIDYLTICLSSKLPPAAKSNSNTYFTSVAEEFRAFAKENDCPVWTAAQFDRAGQDAADVGMGNMGLAIGIAATADFMVVFMQPEEIAAEGMAIGKVLKNRYANKNAFMKFKIGLDNDKQKFYDVDGAAQKGIMDEKELANYENAPASANNSTSTVNTWNFSP